MAREPAIFTDAQPAGIFAGQTRPLLGKACRLTFSHHGSISFLEKIMVSERKDLYAK